MSGDVLRVGTHGAGYDVLVEPGALSRVGEVTRELTGAGTAALVTDETVAALYGARVRASLGSAGLGVVSRSVPPGEGSKSWECAGELLEWLAASRIERDDVVVALGGGVVGDLAGFCAATYMRGIALVQVPTTLLGQVDSAIGGKTAVDLAAGKNLAGAFWPPVAVLADLDCLATLPEREWRSGLAEVAKSAMLTSGDAVTALEVDAEALLAKRDAGAVRRAVSMAAGLKARVVSADEREAGEREALNYGHTLAHAIEKTAGYGALPHGQTVAEGIRFAALLAQRVLGADAAWTARQDGLLDSLGLPAAARPWAPEDLAAAMRADKKVREGLVRFVMTTAPGQWCVERVDSATIDAALAEWHSLGEGGVA